MGLISRKQNLLLANWKSYLKVEVENLHLIGQKVEQNRALGHRAHKNLKCISSSHHNLIFVFEKKVRHFSFAELAL